MGGEPPAWAGENRRTTARFVEHAQRLRFERDTAQCQRDGPTWWPGARAARPEAAPGTVAPRETDGDSGARDAGADATADTDGHTAPYSYSDGNTCTDSNANRHTAADRNPHGLADAGPNATSNGNPYAGADADACSNTDAYPGSDTHAYPCADTDARARGPVTSGLW